ncbi:Extracellular protein SEL-1 and related proteins [Klebsormidium nitens]|uniref:Extracellular protein SEL-1 and related proteins n=1 Tax=Klebsormidium nitens TaxID=105231 RepID=A0A1Y1IAZ3_KLENI|nr:Extracellular protein SEL-1 and related proteins [Klebsormidium nitens]|eukprot:GAQ85887.1 Extracellular protein SEL-1 and related proteins [Klebsormidium nitens]
MGSPPNFLRVASSFAIFLLLISTLVARPTASVQIPDDDQDTSALEEEIDDDAEDESGGGGSHVQIANVATEGEKVSLYVDKALIRSGQKGFSILINEGRREAEQAAEEEAANLQVQSNAFEGLREDGTSERVGEVDPGAWKNVYELPLGDTKARAAEGGIEAMYILGLKQLLGGVGVRRDAVAGVERIVKAAEQGHEHAQSALAFLQDHGYGVERDDARAFLNHHFAAKGGSYQSKMALAYNYVRQQEYELAADLYEEVATKAMSCFHVPGEAPLVETVRLSAGSEQSAEAVAGHRGEDDERIQYIQFKAEKFGEIYSMKSLADLYYWGARGITRDHRKAFSWFLKAAEAGELTSMVQIGQMYGRGVGVQQNSQEAVSWFEKAETAAAASAAGTEIPQVRAAFEAAAGQAQNGLGYMHAHGAGMEKNYTKALALFGQAARKGLPEGSYNLGVMHLNGLGVRRNPSKAREFFSAAAAAQHVGATYQLAKMMHHGIGTKRSYATAVAYYKRIAERGPWGSMMRWAHECYMEGQLSTALLLYSRAADLGYEVAQSNAAWLLEKGAASECLGPTGKRCTDHERYARSHKLWRLASEQGNVQAALLIGDAYYFGRGTKKDLERAAEAYWRAAQQRSAQALFNLGYMHEHGRGLPLDLHLAKRRYDEALGMDRDAALPVKLALAGLWLRTHYGETLIMRALERIPGMCSALFIHTVNFLSNDGNGTVLTLVALLATVLYFRQRQRRNADAGNVAFVEPVADQQPPPAVRETPVDPPDAQM